MLARFRGVIPPKPAEAEVEVADAAPSNGNAPVDSEATLVAVIEPYPLPPAEATAEAAPEVPMAAPVVAAALPIDPVAPVVGYAPGEVNGEEIATALPVLEPTVAEAMPVETEPMPSEEPPAALREAASGAEAVALPQPCSFCGAPRVGTQSYCGDCGLIFPTVTPTKAVAVAATPGAPMARLNGRYELGQLLTERGSVERHRGTDYGSGSPTPVVILRASFTETLAELTLEEVVEEPAEEESDELLPSFDFPSGPVLSGADAVGGGTGWPSLAWERELLDKAQHPSLPRVLDSFIADGYEYLVEEALTGEVLWNVWDDPANDADKKFGWLKQVAEALHQLHKAGAIVEGIRPDLVAVNANGQAVLTDLSDTLPLPLPPSPPIRATHYTAPDLILFPDKVDARADLYSFGAMLYALHVGRELTEMDFELQGVPKPFIPRFPDVHPLFSRLVTKTFCRDPGSRFPTDEACKEDATGFTELIKTLEVCRRTLDNVRLEIAAWTTTGMVRTGNEDAFALLHAVEARQDDVGDCAIVLLADGMGGYEAGEVAAALSLAEMRKTLLQNKLFTALAGQPPVFPLPKVDAEAYKQALLEALKAANKHVYTVSRTPGAGKRGMGCTSEAVYVDGRHVVVGHVGDSRTYHLHQGQLVQLTRDQTLVNRLVELGQITAEEAETHPRRSELQQAIGGQPDCQPGLYSGAMKPGDWVVVCSDGLSNHVTNADLKEMLQSVTSADMAARHLVNLVNLRGATDNATVVVVRAL